MHLELQNTRDCDTIILRLTASLAPCVGDIPLFTAPTVTGGFILCDIMIYLQ
nr:MAG TPA: hypothetical protein [Caudoviricetes sp.]